MKQGSSRLVGMEQRFWQGYLDACEAEQGSLSRDVCTHILLSLGPRALSAGFNSFRQGNGKTRRSLAYDYKDNDHTNETPHLDLSLIHTTFLPHSNS